MPFLPVLHNLFGHSESNKAYDQVYSRRNDYSGNYQPSANNQPEPHHKSSWTHELIGGAAGFAAMKAYEDHCRRTGEQVSHSMMKEMIAGFAGAEVDKLFETEGLDFLDREKARHLAIENAHHIANEKYGPGCTFNPQLNSYGSGPNQYGPGPNQYGPGPNQYGPGPNQYGPGPNQYGPGPNQYGPGPNQYGPGPNQYGPGPNQYGPGPNQYGPGPNQYGPGPNQYGPGPNQYGPGPNQYGPGPNQYGPGPNFYPQQGGSNY